MHRECSCLHQEFNNILIILDCRTAIVLAAKKKKKKKNAQQNKVCRCLVNQEEVLSEKPKAILFLLET